MNWMKTCVAACVLWLLAGPAQAVAAEAEVLPKLSESYLVGTWHEDNPMYLGDPGIDFYPAVFRFDDDNGFVHERREDGRILSVRGTWKLEGNVLRFAVTSRDPGIRYFPDYVNLRMFVEGILLFKGERWLRSRPGYFSERYIRLKAAR